MAALTGQPPTSDEVEQLAAPPRSPRDGVRSGEAVTAALLAGVAGPSLLDELNPA